MGGTTDSLVCNISEEFVYYLAASHGILNVS